LHGLLALRTTLGFPWVFFSPFASSLSMEEASMSLDMSTAVSTRTRAIVQIGLCNDHCAGEIFPTHIRCQGVAWALVGTFLSTLVYVEAAPTALANIKWGYYIIYVGLTAINIVVLYLWCPEVKCSSMGHISGFCINPFFFRRKVCHLKRSMESLETKLWFTLRMR
jgi:Sugar (and other) transporter